MEGQKHTDTPAKDLETCLAKCAELTSQNTKLTRRLRDEKEAKKKYLNEAQELQKELNARTDANSNFEYAVKQIQNQVIGPSSMLESSIAGENMGAFLESSNHEENVSAVAGISEKDTPFPNRTSEQEYDTLREQLSSREQENLALVQSLCKIKEKCAHMEAIYQKELRVKAAEHAEAMENYMTTVNETLSRIESDKHRLENENVKLGEKLQQLDEEIRRQELERSQRSSKGTSTEGETLELAAYTREKESLKARVVDLELQLARERKLMEMVEQKQQLENQHEELHESAAKVEVEKARQNNRGLAYTAEGGVCEKNSPTESRKPTQVNIDGMLVVRKDQARILEQTLQLLFSCEVLVVTEFIKVLVPLMLGLLLATLWTLPSARYNILLRDVTREVMVERMLWCLCFALFELPALVIQYANFQTKLMSCFLALIFSTSVHQGMNGAAGRR
ncbi:uncharacterized protein IUM83_17897 [Phytophthora cinnamomi]|uniref:uncharacterized protein n=1 Tax=Phytophthora cinnamomi TaxID=4785 RepID=UPI00355A9D2F|nr:hypothetical protein IUM83_17897 [Phytophthora cinnamomi]